MTRTRMLWALSLLLMIGTSLNASEPVLYLRFQIEDTVSYGILEGNRVRQISGDLFGNWKKTDTTYVLSQVKLLPPTQPTQVLALAGNYRSHLADATVPPKFQIPQPFHKGPSCLVGHTDYVVLPKDAKTVHYEAEMVIVIGRKCSKVSKEDAPHYVFGVTAGNDISERIWQNDEDVKDVQWWRAKGADTFGPVGPYIVTNVNYDDLMLRMRVNGEIKQEESTALMIHDVASTVSFISQYVTLHPGDLIFTGTPGETSTIKDGDVLEVELEEVGVLRSHVKQESKE